MQIKLGNLFYALEWGLPCGREINDCPGKILSRKDIRSRQVGHGNLSRWLSEWWFWSGCLELTTDSMCRKSPLILQVQRKVSSVSGPPAHHGGVHAAHRAIRWEWWEASRGRWRFSRRIWSLKRRRHFLQIRVHFKLLGRASAKQRQCAIYGRKK